MINTFETWNESSDWQCTLSYYSQILRPQGEIKRIQIERPDSVKSERSSNQPLPPELLCSSS